MEAAEAQSRWKWGWGVLVGVPALFLTAMLFPGIVDLPLCAAKSFLGCDCPGCGLTRSIFALVRGNLRASIDFHPLGIVIALWLAALFARSALELAFRRSFPALLSQRSRDLLLGAFLVALLLQWSVKLIVLLAARHGLDLGGGGP